MVLLKDDELRATLVTGNQLLNVPVPLDWDSDTSPVQPSSVDLHVGGIYLPRAKRRARGGLDRPLERYTLQPGETVVVTTEEQLRLASNIAGFGFPPSHVSFQGILMTNPGHIDPGFVGRLRFAVINMGSDPFNIRRGDVIVTVLFAQLSGPARRDWIARHNGRPARDLVQDDLDRLSRDFLNVEARARDIAQKAVTAASLRGPITSGIVSAVVAGAVTMAVAWYGPSWKDPVAELKRDIAELKKSIDVEQLKPRIDQLEKSVQQLTSASSRRAPSPPR